MDPSYRETCRQGYYGADRDPQDGGHHAPVPQQHHHSQHLQHYPHQLPYHPTLLNAPQQPPFAVNHPELRSRDDYGSDHGGQTMLRSVYSGPGHVPLNHNVPLQTAADQPLNFSPSVHQLTLLQSPSQASFPSVTVVTTAGQTSGRSSHKVMVRTTEQHGVSAADKDSTPQTNTCSESGFSIPSLQHTCTSAQNGHSAQTAQSASQPSVPPVIQRRILTISQQNISAVPVNLSRKKQKRAMGDVQIREKLGSDLPDFLSLRYADSDEDNVAGVEAREKIEKGTVFGPYEGNLLDEETGLTKDSTWELCLRGKVFLYVDGNRKNQTNSMSFIRCAQNEDEQNVEAIQTLGDIYFRAKQVIEPGTELKVFYSDEYIELVGFKTKLNDLDYNAEKDNFKCAMCENEFSSAKRIMRHIKFDHEADGAKELCPVVTWKLKGKKMSENDNTKEAGTKAAKKPVKVEESTEGAEQNHFICTICGKNFPSEGRLEAHSMFHEFTEEHTCPVCGERQRNGFMFTKHMARHENRVHKCVKCNKSYKTRGALYRHERDIHGIPVVRNHVCRFCSIRFAKKLECLKHEMTHKECNERIAQKMAKVKHAFKRKKWIKVKEGGKENERNVTTQTESNAKDNRESTMSTLEKPLGRSRRRKNKTVPQEEDMLGKAVDYYTKPRPYKCRYCTKRYIDKTKAYEHEKEVHEGKGSYKCNHCTRVFMNEARFLDHLKNHEQNRMYRCSLCPRTFASQSALTNHQGEHTGLKPFKCEICGRGFRVKNAVYQHKRRMHQVREMRFFCAVCSKGFPDKGGLTKHERRHKGIRPFVCLVCGKGFTVKHSLQVHLRSMHEEEKPFTCPICSKTFSLNHSYTSHMFRHKVQGEGMTVQLPDEQIHIPQ